MGVPKSKKRYFLSLTTAKVERFQALCKRLGLPPSTMSNVCDDCIEQMSATFQLAVEQGKLDVEDLFRVMGQQFTLLADVEKEKSLAEGRLQKRKEVNNANKTIARQKRNKISN